MGNQTLTNKVKVQAANKLSYTIYIFFPPKQNVLLPTDLYIFFSFDKVII